VAYIMAGSPFQMSKESRVWTPITTGGIGQPEPIDGIGKLVMSHVVPGRDFSWRRWRQVENRCAARAKLRLRWK